MNPFYFTHIKLSLYTFRFFRPVEAAHHTIAGHPISASYKGRSYEVFGYIHFSRTPKLMRFFGFLEKNGFEIVDKKSSSPVAMFVFVKVKNGKIVHHYKNENKLNMRQREVNLFWKNIFEQMRNLKEIFADMDY